MDQKIDQSVGQEYVKPQVEDYGDLAELTAGGTTGSRVDGTFTLGQTATFLSS